MSDRKRNKKSRVTDFIRYHQNKMTLEERHSFERELQKDPFSEEAHEGFADTASDETIKDIPILQKRLSARIGRRPTLTLYRIAAAVAVLMVLSGGLFVLLRKEEVITLSENKVQEKPKTDSVPAKETLADNTVIVPEKKRKPSRVVPPVSKTETTSVKTNIAEPEAAEPVAEVNADSDSTKTDLAEITIDEAREESYAAGKKAAMSRAAAAPVSLKSARTDDYKPPQPVAGMDSFNIYLEKNIRNPYPGIDRKSVVVVSFSVNTDSTLAGFEIISSPGKEWSEEAIRLIKSGPFWKPAEENGLKIEAEARISVVFR